MKNSSLIFIYDKEENKFFMFYPRVIFKENRSFEKKISRKIKKLTGLRAKEIISLKWGSVYKINGKEIKEIIFLARVDRSKDKLRKKYNKLEWLKLDDFIRRIHWEDSKDLLKEVLLKAVENEIYFDKKERGQ